MTIKIDKKGENWINLQQSEMFGKASMITWQSVWLQVNTNHWARRCIQCAIRSPFATITLKSHIIMEFCSSLWMIRATHAHTSQFPMLQSQNVDKDVLYQVYDWFCKISRCQNWGTTEFTWAKLINWSFEELSKWLLIRNVTTVGTVQKGPHGIPHELFDAKGRKKFSVTCHYEEKKRHVHNIIYCYYKVKREKHFVILSTMRPMDACTKDDDKFKP